MGHRFKLLLNELGCILKILEYNLQETRNADSLYKMMEIEVLKQNDAF